MIVFLVKDLLTLLRDRKEIILLLLMPTVLIAILGFALDGLLGTGVGKLHIPVAVVNEDHEEEGIHQFLAELESRSLPHETYLAMEAATEELRPATLLQQVLSSPELEELVQVHELDAERALQALEAGEVVVVLTLPQGYTHATLSKILLEEGSGASLHLQTTDGTSLRASIFHDILASFVRTLNFQTAMNQTINSMSLLDQIRIDHQEMGTHGVTDGIEVVEAVAAIGGRESVTRQEPITTFQYYTLGMAVMFVLYIASNVAARGYREMQQHVYYRIVLAGTPAYRYLLSKMGAATLIAFLQISILFGLSTLLFQTFTGKPLSLWIDLMIITAVLSACVGALATLLISLSYRLKSEAITALFSGGILALMAFLGGSFFPLTALPPTVVAIGGWTPNGAALSGYLQVLQGMEATSWLQPVVRIGVLALCVLVISILTFPRRREA